MSRSYKKLAWSALAVLVIAMVLSGICTVVKAGKETASDRENELRSTTQLVDASVVEAFIQPITVAKAMAEDITLKEYLIKAGTDPEGTDEQMQQYLSSLRDGLGYKMMFAVCDRSCAYFTCDGITSYITKSSEDGSEWYEEFKDSGKDMDLNVDVEESTGWELSVFVNKLVTDENKNVLGVCGTGVEMTQLQSLFEIYERIYQVKVDITDETGLVLIDTDVSQIENKIISLPELDKISDGEYYYEKSADGDRVITYLDELDMYLVVTNTRSEAVDIISEIRMPIICLVAGLIFSTVLMAAAEKKKEDQE